MRWPRTIAWVEDGSTHVLVLLLPSRRSPVAAGLWQTLDDVWAEVRAADSGARRPGERRDDDDDERGTTTKTRLASA